MKRHHLITAHSSYFGSLLILLLMLTFQALPVELRQWLMLDREALLAGQYWRLLSAHLVHLSWWHLAANGLALLLFQQLYGQALSLVSWLRLWLVMALGVALGILWGNPEVSWYAGLSGVVVGLIVAGALKACREQPQISGILLGFIAVKIAWEQWQGTALIHSPWSGTATLVDAHLYGALSGLFYWGLGRSWCDRRTATD